MVGTGMLSPASKLSSDLKILLPPITARRAKFFTYGFVAAFILFTAFLAFSPSSNSAATIFTTSSTFSTTIAPYKSQFSSFISHLLPFSEPQIPPEQAAGGRVGSSIDPILGGGSWLDENGGVGSAPIGVEEHKDGSLGNEVVGKNHSSVWSENEAPAASTEAPAVNTEAPAAKTDVPVLKTEAPSAKTEPPATKTDAPVPKTDAPVPKTDAPAEKNSMAKGVLGSKNITENKAPAAKNSMAKGVSGTTNITDNKAPEAKNSTTKDGVLGTKNIMENEAKNEATAKGAKNEAPAKGSKATNGALGTKNSTAILAPVSNQTNPIPDSSHSEAKKKNQTAGGDIRNSTAIPATSTANDRHKQESEIDKLRHCDIFHGNWVHDDSYPLYPEGSCPHIDEPFDCYHNGRPDRGYQKLRWQPTGCNIPRLNGTDMLEKLRGRRLVFVGDSLNRNMWESLVCILRNSVKDKKRVFEASGRSHFKTEGSYSFVFKDYGCTVEYFRSPFLVQEWEMPDNNGSKKETLRLDIVEKSASNYKDAYAIIFNTGHWWTHDKTAQG